MVCQVGLTQVEFPFESAPRFIVQRSLAIKPVDPLAFCRDECKLDFIGRSGSVLLILPLPVRGGEVTAAVRQLCAKLPYNVLRQTPFRSKPLETLGRRLDGASAREQLLFPVRL